jgi:putrescine---pyruvate transaminase
VDHGTGTRLWHPFADMAAVDAAGELVLASGEGAYVTDEGGRRYLDATASLWYCNVGHGRTEIADAAATQMGRLAAYSTFGDTATRPTLDLAERLAALSPAAEARVFFTSGGSDAVDTAVKLARRYWNERGQPARTLIVHRERAYHGMHLAGTGLSGIAMNRSGYGDLPLGAVQAPWDDAEGLARVLDEVGPERVAAFFCEPVIGAGGVYAPPPGYLERAREICRDRDVLFVADEVICGYGRTGAMFASDRWALDPDIVLTAKGLTSGYLPMGAVLVAGRVAEPFWSTPGLVWRHGYTYSGHAAAAAAALANLDIVAREALVERVRALEPVLAEVLRPLASSPLVSDVRAGVGLLAAVTLDAAARAEDPALAGRVVAGLRARGVLTRMLADGSLQISPPFVVDRSDLTALSDAIAAALSDEGAPVATTERPADGPATASITVDLLPEQTRDDLDPGEASGDGDLDRFLADKPPHHVD